MRGTLTIARKDLMRSLRDRSALVVMVVAPLGLAFILSSVLGGGGGSFTVRFAVADQDGGAIGRSFTNGPLAALDKQGFAQIVTVSAPTAARALARRGDVDAAFVIPRHLTAGMRAGRKGASIAVVGNSDSPIGTQIAASVAAQFAGRVNAVQLAVATLQSGRGNAPLTAPEMKRLQKQAAAISPPASVVQRSVGSKQFDDKTFFAAGMAVFFLFFTAQFGAVSMLRERSDGTLARLLASPVSRRSIVGAKALYGFVLGAGSLAVLIVASTLLLGARWGDPLGVALLVVSGVFAAMGVQSLVTTLAKTEEQASGYGSIVGVTLGLLGGTFIPLSQSPGFLAKLSLVTPQAWLMRGFGELSGGAAGLPDVLPAVAAVLAFGIVTGGLALARSSRLVLGP